MLGTQVNQYGVARMNYLRRHWQWIIVSVAAISAVILGYCGVQEYFVGKGASRPWWDIGYFVIYLFAIESGETSGTVPWQLAVARWLAAGVSLWAIIKAALLLFNERFQAWRPAHWHNHVVVCGIGRKGLCLIEEFRNAGWRVAAIERDVDNPHVNRCRELGVVVFLGDASDAALLAKAGAAHARHVISITGDDGANVAIAMRLHHMLKQHPGHRFSPVTCLVHVVDLHLCELFKQHSLFRDDTDRLDVRVFNTYENAARMLFAEHPIEGRSPEERQKTPHLIILGFGRMGESVALQAAKTAHYASGKPLRVTVVDQDATRLRDTFFGRYPQYPQICSIDFIDAEIAGADTIARLARWALEPGDRVTLVLCLDDDSQSLAAAMRLAARLRGHAIPLHVRMSQTTGLAALFEDGQGTSGWLQNLHPFAMIAQTCRISAVVDDKLDTLARAIHEAYVDNSRKNNVPASDPAMLPWERSDPMFRDSNRQQADHIPVKLRAIGCRSVSETAPGMPVSAFDDTEVELLARMEHDRFVAERLLAGWTSGPRDPERRTSPYLVPWEELDEDVRDKDRSAVREIPVLLARVGEKVIRA